MARGVAAIAASLPLAVPALAQAPAQQAPSPDSPLTELPDFGVAWPDLAAPATPGTAPPPPTQPAELRHYRVTVTGAEALGGAFTSHFRQLSALVTQEGKPANAAQIDRRARQDEALMQELLHAAGRYDGTVSTGVTPTSTPIAVRIAVEPGPAYTIAALTLPGIEAAGPDAPALTSALALHAGDRIDAEAINAAVASWRAELGRRGYPFAKVEDPTVTVDHAATRASVALPVSLGARARFGRIVSTGARPVFSLKHLGQIARFHPGDPYDAARLEDFRRALIQTGLVSVATVAPQATADAGVVDVAVHIERAPPRTIAGEFGYGTGEGAKAQLSWQHRNLIPPEGGVTFQGVLGTREQSLGALFRRSNFRARDRVFTAQLQAAHTRFDAFDARTFTISTSLERQTNIIWQKKWSWSVGGEFLASDERDTIQATGQPRRRTFLVGAFPGTLSYDGSDDLLNPTRGWRISARVSPEASLQRKFDGYTKFQFDASGYQPVGGHVVLAGRVRLGAIEGAARDIIAPSRRFYAGGGGSVRGYGYQKIGPVDVDGDPVGGRGLAEAAVETRVRFGNFGVVPFLDAGNLYDAPVPKFTHLRFGTGLGARYYSSFGPIRVDVGTPINRRTGESRLAVYVSLGQAF